MSNEESIERKVDRMLMLIQGNDLDDEDTGMIGKLNSLEKRMQEREKRDNWLIGIAVGLSFPAGAGLGSLLEFLK